MLTLESQDYESTIQSSIFSLSVEFVYELLDCLSVKGVWIHSYARSHVPLYGGQELAITGNQLLVDGLVCFFSENPDVLHMFLIAQASSNLCVTDLDVGHSIVEMWKRRKKGPPN